MIRKNIIVPPPPTLSPFEDEVLWKLGLTPTILMELAIHLYPDYVHSPSYYYDACYDTLSATVEGRSNGIQDCDNKILLLDQNSDTVFSILIVYSKYFAPYIEMSGWNQGPGSRILVAVRPHGRNLVIETDIYQDNV